MERPARVTPLMAWLVAGALAATTAPLGAQVALDVLELPGGVLSDDFGSGMALDGDTLLIGVPRGNSLQPGPGFVVVYRRDDRGTPSDPTDDTWTEAGPRIEASAGLAGEKFGYSVALEGDTAVVGAYKRPESSQHGSVYFYERDRGGTPDDFSDDVWIEVDREDSGGLLFWFGYTVVLEEDSVYIGEPASKTSFTGGRAYVYERDDRGTPERFDDQWVQGAQFVSVSPTDVDEFGIDLAVRGTTLWVGAPGFQNNRGKAEVFERDTLGTQTKLDDVWHHVELVRPLVQEKDARFGTSIALSGDTALVGSIRVDASVPDGPGRVETFVRDDAGTPGDALDDTWPQTGGFEASLATKNRFGEHVRASGPRVLVGAPGYFTTPGRAYVFERYDHGTPDCEADDVWYETRRLTANIGSSDYFGGSGLLDGELALVGAQAPGDGSDAPGAVHLYAVTDPMARLRSDLTFVPAPGGGAQTLTLDAGVANAGRSYLVLGSAGGTEPVTLVNGLSLPLVPDLYMTATLQGPNTNGLESTLGVLDAAGKATARIVFPEGADPFLAGLALHHAYVLFTPTLDFVSNAVPLQLVPAYTLLGDVAAISVATGGTQEFELRAGASAAGSVYLVLGSVTGTTPGFALDGFTVPLNLDFYTQLSFGEANGPLFENTYGVLDSLGTGAARLVLPAGLTAAAGLELHHAFVVFDAVTGTANFASNPLALTLIP